MARFEFIEDIEKKAYEELTNPPEGIALPWWSRFNELLGGLRMNELTVLTAPTGSGKTTFTCNLACQALIAGVGVYVCSAEVGNVLFLLGMYSALEGKDYVGGRKHDKRAVDDLIVKHRHVLRNAKIVFSRNDDRIEAKELIDEIGVARDSFKIGLAILDNLQFMTPVVSSDKQLQVTDGAVRDFVRYVRVTPIHCLLIAHPRKSGGGTGRIESEESVKGSSSIYQECSNFLSLNRIDPDLLTDPRSRFTNLDREVKFHKIRRRGYNQGKSVFFTYNSGRYEEKPVEWRGRT